MIKRDTLREGTIHMTVEINGKTYLTAGEAADYLGVSAATFLKFQTEYNLKWLTRPGMGQRKFFAKDDLEPLKEFRPGEDGQQK